jgi:prlF antitoxin for toxin YhaV_toxin
MQYSGRATRSGNSQAMAFEKALFRAHPEFAAGPLSAQYVAPGYLLVHAAVAQESAAPEQDMVLGAYLAFLEREMQKHPELIQPLSPDLLARAEALIGDMEVDLNEDLGDEFDID